MEKYKRVLLAFMVCFPLVLTACGKSETEDPVALSDSADQTLMAVTFQAVVLEVKDEMILAEPAEGSAECLSADKIYLHNKEGMELEAGDKIEIEYDGNLMETYPAQIGEVYSIVIVEKAKNDTRHDKIPAVMVNGKLYCDTGKESTADARCGMMDGQITSSVDGDRWPAKDGESNFGTGFGYQYGENDTIEIFINEKWMVFEQKR